MSCTVKSGKSRAISPATEPARSRKAPNACRSCSRASPSESDEDRAASVDCQMRVFSKGRWVMVEVLGDREMLGVVNHVCCNEYERRLHPRCTTPAGALVRVRRRSGGFLTCGSGERCHKSLEPRVKLTWMSYRTGHIYGRLRLQGGTEDDWLAEESLHIEASQFALLAHATLSYFGADPMGIRASARVRQWPSRQRTSRLERATDRSTLAHCTPRCARAGSLGRRSRALRARSESPERAPSLHRGLRPTHR